MRVRSERTRAGLTHYTSLLAIPRADWVHSRVQSNATISASTLEVAIGEPDWKNSSLPYPEEGSWD